MEILKLTNVTKSFGARMVVKDLSLSVEEHSIYGFIGKNGAGKTTTMKLILGLLKPDSGEIRVCGETVTYGNTKTNRFIGYLPDVPEFYGYMKPSEYLELCGGISGMEKEAVHRRSEELLQMVGLSGEDRRISGFSRGMKQRLGIAQALLGKPRLFICDEPTSALDPLGRRDILDILKQVSAHTTVLFSTHVLADVERICDHVGLLDGGRLILDGELERLREQERRDSVSVEVMPEYDHMEELKAAFKELPVVTDVLLKEHHLTVQLRNAAGAGSQIIKYLTDHQVPVRKYEVEEPTLENLFMEAVEE